MEKKGRKSESVKRRMAQRRQTRNNEAQLFEGVSMPTYIIGAKLTESGPRDNESFRQHAESAARVRQQHGGRLIGAWVTFGRYDMVIVTEFPSQQAALAAVETNLAKGLFTYEVAEAIALEDFLS